MAKNIKRTVLSEKLPRNKHIAWAKPEGDNINLKIFEDDKWKPVAGSGSGSSTTISSDVTYNELITMATNAGVNLVDVDTSEDPDQAIQENNTNLINYFKTQNLSSEEHGSVINVNYHYNDQDREVIALLYEDGFVMTANSNGGINIPPQRRYKASFSSRDQIVGIYDEFSGLLPNILAHRYTNTFYDDFNGNVYTLYWVNALSSGREVSKWITFNENRVGDDTQVYTYEYTPYSVTLYLPSSRPTIS